MHRAVQPGVGREVAIKVIRAELADDPVFIRRFDAEAQLVSHLEHPHIVPLYDFWREPGGAYMVMRLLSGHLAKSLDAGPMDPTVAARVAQQLGSALAVAHRAAVIHGDLKPSNVLVYDDDNAYLSDFGVATIVGEGDAEAPSDSSGYESPERLAGEPPSSASDQFALAVLMVQALTGVLPFGKRAIVSPHDQIASLHVQRPSIPAAVDEVVWKATSWDARDRYRDVGEFTDALIGALGGAVGDVAPEGEVVNPYIGLRAFSETDGEMFFGRDSAIDEMLSRLSQGGVAGRFVTVVGASGSGKSSVVRAGLVPRLRAGAIPEADEWFVTTMVPGSRPFAELEAALRSIAVSEPTKPFTGAEWDDDEVGRIVRAAVPDRRLVLLIIDQLEEPFTMVSDEQARRAFLDGLAKVVTDPDSNLRVVATLRADFYDRPLRYHRFGYLVKTGTLTLVGMTAGELEQAITQPAARSGVEIEPALATEIVADVVDQPSALPLLQYTLTELFEHRAGRVVSKDSYRRLGGVDAAVAGRAEQVFRQAPAEDRELVRQLFLRLITVDETGTATRRRALATEVTWLVADTAGMERIINRFGDARLLTFDRDPATRAPTVEVAHEALIRHWPRLGRWVAEAGEGLRVRVHLTDAATAWDQRGRDQGDLYRGARLETATSWAQDHPDTLNPLEQEFLQAGIDQHEAEQAAERQHLEQQHRANRRLKGLLTGVGLALVGALIAGFVAVDQRNEAQLQEEIATVGELAAASVANLALDPELSVLLALEAVDTMSESGVYVAEAEEALHRAVLNSRQLLSIPNWDNGLAHFSPDGERFIALTHPTDDAIPQVWNVATLQPALDLIGHEGHVLDAVFSPDGARIATSSIEDGTVRVWNAVTGETERVLDLTDVGGPSIPVFSTAGTRLATSTLAGEVWSWDLDVKEAVLKLQPPHAVPWAFHLAFSPDDATLAVVYSEPVVLVWDTQTGELLREVEHGGGVAWDVGFSPDGTWLVTGGDGPIKIWDTESWDRIATFRGHEDFVTDLQVSADGRWVASGGVADVLVWDLDTLDTVHRIIGHDGDVDGIDLSPDGRYLLTGSWTDTTTRLWDTSLTWSHQFISLPGREGSGGAVAFSPDGVTLAASRSDSLITLWDRRDGSDIATMGGPGAGESSSLDHTADGRLIAAGGVEGVKVFEAQTGVLVAAPFNDAEAFDVVFPPNGTMLATAAKDRGVELWPLPGGEPTTLIGEVHGRALAFSPDGSMLAMSYYDLGFGEFFVDVVDTTTGEVLSRLAVGFQTGGEHNRAVESMTFSADGDRLVTVSWDSVGVAWDTESWEPVQRLEGHNAEVRHVAVDPIRNEIATASADGTVKVWDLDTGKTRLTFYGLGGFNGVSYSPDGRYLAGINEVGVIQLFMLDLDELVTEAKSRLTRTWSEAECIQYLDTTVCS